MEAVSKKERLVTAASELFHQHGIGQTSIAQIAERADVPLGNVYYYFKTKEELALEVMKERKNYIISFCRELDETQGNPQDRLISVLRFYDKIREDFAKYGCPIGCIVQESKSSEDVVAKAAANYFSEFLNWSERQFASMGHARKSRDLAVSFLARIQGIGVVAKAFGDSKLISHEIKELEDWVRRL